MADYQELRNRIHGPTVCLPIFYADDLAVDLDAMARYGAWIRDAGIPCTCMTHGYSQMGYITAEENLQISRTYASVFGEQTVFLAATLGELWNIQETIDQHYAAGAHGVFILPPMAASQDGDAYTRFVCQTAERTDVPLFVYSYGSQAQPGTPMLPIRHYETLVEHDNLVGLKEDVNVAAYRMQLIQRFGDRLAMIGGGTMRIYIQFHHYPCQSELDGFFAPRRALQITRLLDQKNYPEALRMVEQWELSRSDCHGVLNFLAVNQVIMYALGFARSWKLRPPLATATDEQAQHIMTFVEQHPELFEAPAQSPG